MSALRSVNNKVLFAGRLADYKYYNMDQAVARALGVFEKQVAGGKRS
jgi:UDP-galactopyranose mutase